MVVTLQTKPIFVKLSSGLRRLRPDRLFRGLYYLKDKAELSRICDRLANALAPDGRLLVRPLFRAQG
jgi:hypothetical protein